MTCVLWVLFLCVHVCVCVCVYLHLVYVGVTSKALIVRLRKHQTDASSFQDCSTLHRLMLQTDSAHWGIIPLQFMSDEWYASVRERHWWFVFKKWPCNDVAPGISTEGQGSGPRGWLNQRVLQVLHSMKEARQIKDFPWATTWAGELLSLSAWLQIALLSGYALPQVTRAAHSAVTRGLSTSPNDHTATTRYLYTVRHLLPMPHCCHLTLCAAWLRRHAHWAGDSYSSWHLDPSLSPDGTTGFWCGDWEILHLHAAKVKPSNHDCPPWETMCV